MSMLGDKIAIITGATGGIGEAAARRFAAEGARLALLGRSAERVNALVASLDAGERARGFVADAADGGAMDKAVRSVLGECDRIDVLFANAGTEGEVRPLEEQSRAAFEAVLETNVIGVWLAMKAVVPAMKSQRTGSIIVTSSTAGLAGIAGVAPYVASKHAVNGLVKTAALELGPHGIRVNAIAPGPIDNRMMRSLEQQRNPEDPDAQRRARAAAQPLGRYGTNEEVAALALFLASEESSYCTGTVHAVDGGFTAAWRRRDEQLCGRIPGPRPRRQARGVPRNGEDLGAGVEGPRRAGVPHLRRR
jgi:NAD(P)-dependent dehydrogenase (short-subunit alcohol dehydrogenase family)